MEYEGEFSNDNSFVNAKTYLHLINSKEYKTSVSESAQKPPPVMLLRKLAKPGIERELVIMYKSASAKSDTAFTLTTDDRNAIKTWQDHLYSNSTYITDGNDLGKDALGEFAKTRDFAKLYYITEKLAKVIKILSPPGAAQAEKERIDAIYDVSDRIEAAINVGASKIDLLDLACEFREVAILCGKRKRT
jgi:hypothetical protein